MDLSIASVSLGGSIDWFVQTSYNSNDHWPITLKLFKSQPIEFNSQMAFTKPQLVQCFYKLT